ncbi:MAG: ATP-binding cassette domain-containing protein [Elusimicrobia bacterium]|nr:ATP-binding cassette domain-containing protein [Elusimicrobiota bacterium]MBD3412413.1 ATP-binding cassette domain-containing protein [Elusimicrobiota bacterium]
MIHIHHISKTYTLGDIKVRALQSVSLSIQQGEFVAIMGPSGSGKSTLMHILGLLDVPDTGSYQLFGKELSCASADELSTLRSSSIGFVFQQFNLLARTTALENVSLPLLYSRGAVPDDRAHDILTQVGLGERMLHKPNELSGGQQQRVAIARALINNPSVLFADEPTGNLDSTSGNEIMELLTDLNEQGITLVIVTHDERIASRAKRIITMFDGKITGDTASGQGSKKSVLTHSKTQQTETPQKTYSKNTILQPLTNIPFAEIQSHFKQAVRALAANKVRTGLSMLGILIGVAAVIAMLALGTGAQKAVEAQLSSLGSNIVSLRPGSTRSRGVSQEAGSVTRLTLADAREIQSSIPSVKRVSPQVRGRGQVVFGNRNWNTSVYGTGPDYALMRNTVPDIGRYFTEEETVKRARVAVIGRTVARELFEDSYPIGEYIKINKINFQIIGILPEKGASFHRDQDDIIMIPVTTAMHRLLGKEYVDSIDIEIKSRKEIDQAQEDIKQLLMQRHRIKDSDDDSFSIRNMAEIQEAVSSTSKTMSLLLASIAAISLIVGGIGIMNIMLVSVTERTREIGLRKAIGAKRRDILSQFLIEALVVSCVGGGLGIILGCLITYIISVLAEWAVYISVPAVLVSFLFSAFIGIGFGLWPAQKAAALNPIDALRYE